MQVRMFLSVIQESPITDGKGKGGEDRPGDPWKCGKEGALANGKYREIPHTHHVRCPTGNGARGRAQVRASVRDPFSQRWDEGRNEAWAKGETEFQQSANHVGTQARHFILPVYLLSVREGRLSSGRMYIYTLSFDWMAFRRHAMVFAKCHIERTSATTLLIAL